MDLVPETPSVKHVYRVQIVTFAIVMLLVLFTIVSAAARSSPWTGSLFALAGCVASLLWYRPSLKLGAEGALDRLECVSVACARSASTAALFAFLSGVPVLRWGAVAAFAWAVGLVAFALVRDRSRARFLERVYAGDHPDLHVVRDADVRGFELLPPLLSGTITDAVIAHANKRQDYRTSEGSRPIARVMRSLVKMESRIAKRRRSALVTTAVVACAATIVMIAPWSQPARAQTKPAIAAPACRDTIPYFEERLAAIPGVGRATLIVHGASGDVVYVPKTGLTTNAELDAKVLETARAIPCNDKLALGLAQPRYVAFDVSAELVVGEGADSAAIQRDAEEQVRALFQPDARAIDSEHFGFGATEKTFGYRVRHTLRHVSGVNSVKLVIDGGDVDVPLEATDFPTLRSLSIGVVR